METLKQKLRRWFWTGLLAKYTALAILSIIYQLVFLLLIDGFNLLGFALTLASVAALVIVLILRLVRSHKFM